MKMAQTMVYHRLGHRYPFFFLTSYPFTNIIFLVTLLQIMTCGHHYHYDGTGMDCMTTLAPTQDLFSKLVITFV